MQFDPNKLESSIVYKLLTGSIIPRPIGWISSVDQNGINNLAPFSYFNIVGEKHIMFSTAKNKGQNKDTLNNILQNNEFVLNMVTEDVVEAMNMTSKELPANVDEFLYANLTTIDCELIKPKRVKESKISFECKMIHSYTMPHPENNGATMVIGEIVMMHFDDDVLLDNYKINMENYKPVSRLAGSSYSKIGELFSIKRS
ncbi:flavin reductase family protein [Flavobacterium sp.]|jgi:flavin reductase (DIM6/NTAB) family NADH-FMN oxidoreductase RutF|uniref:flavin reductase family protein n=1 Tax=Flavobacterium sp. TaxID=239 RepID=UPI0037BE9FF2